ncbi:hypothetical protein BD309DRAFT_948345 [Dichomitus squalens]|uniref:Uncharacterized protein n=1 Tax=Dichomitus squalens TaxID=114155 RepID=A0A4V2K9J5_9APHY|nr:hypothetical protein BD309DRAFT_948345 [Dichomitus squalens]TBU64118.1 hypothetical protein BD310DRAFT_915394 [Dichomitus squalens]
MDGDDEDMDLETAQAQIDMSMAFVNDLVSGWMKNSNAKLPTSTSRVDEEKELEEYMRRPPRLGVGAPVPGSSDIRSRETAKLRNKLVTNGKKRAREDEEASSTPGPSAMVISDDEEESRARAITKKARIDPFAPKQKEKKKGKADQLAAQSTTSPSKTASLPSKPRTVEPATPVPLATSPPTKTAVSPPKANTAEHANKYSDIEEIPEPTGVVAAALSKSAKRKKRKKDKSASTAGGEPNTSPKASAGPSHTPSQSKDTTAPAPPRGPAIPTGEKREVIVIKDTPPPDAPPSSFLASALAKAKSFLKAVSGDGSLAATPVASLQTSPTRPQPPKPVPQPSPQQLDPFGHPLLNLSGPPPDVGDEEAGASKKKRKKRKKKRKHAMTDAVAHKEVIDVDADDGEEDET